MKGNFLTVIFINCLLFGSLRSANAQYGRNPSAFRFGIEAGIGTTTAHSPFGYGLSFGPFIDYTMSYYLSISGSIGYAGLFTKDTSPVADYYFIPLKTTLKIFPADQRFYAAATVGTGFGIVKKAKPSFIFGGGLGFEWLNRYDISIKFEGYRQRQSSITYQPINGQFLATFAYYF